MLDEVLEIKQRRNRFFQVIISFGLCVLLMMGCSQAQNPSSRPANADKNTITIGTILRPRTLDPADSYELAGLMVIYNLGETLYSYKLGTTELQPHLAIDLPKISENGLTYTIPLRQGIKFHDGTPFNAEAMAFSLNRFIKNGGEPSFLLSDTVETIQATGEYELTVTLKAPFAAFTALLAYPGACAISPKAYEIGEGKFIPEKFVGTGPYQLISMSSDSLRLEAFADYWGEKPKNRGINLQLYPSNPANLFNAFRTQAIDVAYQSLMPQQVKLLKAEAEQGKVQVIESSGSVINFIALNMNSDPLRQKLVRQAIASLVDREMLNERILQGQGKSLYSMIPLSFASYKPVFQEAYGDHNVEKARQLLQKAGYSKENPVTVQIWHSSGSINASIVAALFKALSKRDLEGAIQFQPNSIAGAAYFKNIGKGLYESTVSNWYPDFLDPDNYIYPFLSCPKGSASKGCEEGGGQSQGSFYYNEQMNQWIDQQRQEADPVKRNAILAKIQTQLADDVPYIPLWQTKDFAFAQKDIQGVIINPSQTFPFWTIERR
ncbi:MAG: ABC transporter substrate-binding protein [Snowella sp.]|nr:ABC transporter substrate-binding protein [Snowella sp.]